MSLEATPYCCRVTVYNFQLYYHMAGTGTTDLNAFSAEFARVVTAPTNNEEDWVARNGNESIYGVLKEMLPQVSTDCYLGL